MPYYSSSMNYRLEGKPPRLHTPRKQLAFLAGRKEFCREVVDAEFPFMESPPCRTHTLYSIRLILQRNAYVLEIRVQRVWIPVSDGQSINLVRGRWENPWGFETRLRHHV